MLAEQFIRSNEDKQNEVVLEADNNVSELKKLKVSFEQRYVKLENSLNEKFKSLNDLLEERRQFLIDKLNKYHKECQNVIDLYLSTFNNRPELESNENHSSNKINDIVSTLKKAIDQFDYWTEENDLIDDKNLITYFENLNNLVKKYSRPTYCDELLGDSKLINDCSINGDGLKECLVNKEASFDLKFKNRLDSSFTKSSVSFLGKKDIKIK